MLATPPMAPSTVFFGLMTGASLCLPKARPAKYAPESDVKARTRGMKISAAPWSMQRMRTRADSSSGTSSPAKAIAAISEKLSLAWAASSSPAWARKNAVTPARPSQRGQPR